MESKSAVKNMFYPVFLCLNHCQQLHLVCPLLSLIYWLQFFLAFIQFLRAWFASLTSRCHSIETHEGIEQHYKVKQKFYLKSQFSFSSDFSCWHFDSASVTWCCKNKNWLSLALQDISSWSNFPSNSTWFPFIPRISSFFASVSTFLKNNLKYKDQLMERYALTLFKKNQTYSVASSVFVLASFRFYQKQWSYV